MYTIQANPSGTRSIEVSSENLKQSRNMPYSAISLIVPEL